MGKQLANVITIVIAGEFFAKGLTSTGSIDAMIQGAQTTGFGASGLTLVMIAIIAVCAILMGSGNAPFFAFAKRTAIPMAVSCILIVVANFVIFG